MNEHKKYSSQLTFLGKCVNKQNRHFCSRVTGFDNWTSIPAPRFNVGFHAHLWVKSNFAITHDARHANAANTFRVIFWHKCLVQLTDCVANFLFFHFVLPTLNRGRGGNDFRCFITVTRRFNCRPLLRGRQLNFPFGMFFILLRPFYVYFAYNEAKHFF